MNMKQGFILASAALVLAMSPAIAAKRGAAGGQTAAASSVAPLTAQECRDLGGRVEDVRPKFCSSKKQCKSEVRNQTTGGIELHYVCIDEAS